MSLWKDWQATTGSECGQKLNSFFRVDIQFSVFTESIIKIRAALNEFRTLLVKSRQMVLNKDRGNR